MICFFTEETVILMEHGNSQNEAVSVADVAVTKHHQWLDEIEIHPENQQSCFQENSVMQYAPSTLDTIQFAQHLLGGLLQM